MTVRAVFFDWGHTLFDTAGSVEFVVDWTLRNGGVTDGPSAGPDPADVRALWDHARRRSRTPEEIVKGRDKSAAMHRECWLALWSELDARWPGVAAALYEFETSAAGWTPYVDTEEVLRDLHERNMPVVIVSDVPFDLRPILAHYGLDGLVHSFVLSGEHGTIKPELELFRIALQTVGVEPDEVLMVGDNAANDGAAVEIGIRTLLLPAVPSGSPRGLWAVADLIDG
ncbi:MAG: hydrolase [Acidimicrobiales bacterium]|nr:hydrolase [Acidimicrobiales bacterium]